jgi:E3 ubiquitin-protein ligase SHPRH
MDEANEIIDGLFNEQSNLLWSWRSHIYALLTENLSSNGEEADGQEYSRSLETQGEAETYLQAYAALLADHREALTAERTLLAVHDVREKKLRRTKAAMKAAAAAAEMTMDVPDVELQPEHEVLRKDLSGQRKEILQQFQGRAIRSVLYDLTAAAARIHNDNDPEKHLMKQCTADLRQLIGDQGERLHYR